MADKLEKHLVSIENTLGGDGSLPKDNVDKLDWHLNKIEELLEEGTYGNSEPFILEVDYNDFNEIEQLKLDKKYTSGSINAIKIFNIYGEKSRLFPISFKDEFDNYSIAIDDVVQTGDLSWDISCWVVCGEYLFRGQTYIELLIDTEDPQVVVGPVTVLGIENPDDVLYGLAFYADNNNERLTYENIVEGLYYHNVANALVYQDDIKSFASFKEFLSSISPKFIERRFPQES